METRVVQLQMYLLMDAASNMISDETVGIRVGSSITVSILNKVVKKTGEAERRFAMAKRIATWIIVVAGGGGIIIFLLLTFALFKVKMSLNTISFYRTVFELNLKTN